MHQSVSLVKKNRTFVLSSIPSVSDFLEVYVGVAVLVLIAVYGLVTGRIDVATKWNEAWATLSQVVDQLFAANSFVGWSLILAVAAIFVLLPILLLLILVATAFLPSTLTVSDDAISFKGWVWRTFWFRRVSFAVSPAQAKYLVGEDDAGGIDIRLTAGSSVHIPAGFDEPAVRAALEQVTNHPVTAA